MNEKEREKKFINVKNNEKEREFKFIYREKNMYVIIYFMYIS